MGKRYLVFVAWALAIIGAAGMFWSVKRQSEYAREQCQARGLQPVMDQIGTYFCTDGKPVEVPRPVRGH